MLVFVNEFVIFSLFAIFVFVNENHTASVLSGFDNAELLQYSDWNGVIGRLNELLSALGFDAEVGSWLSNLIIHHAGHVTQASSTAPAAAKC